MWSTDTNANMHRKFHPKHLERRLAGLITWYDGGPALRRRLVYILRCVIGMTRNLLSSHCSPLSSTVNSISKLRLSHGKEPSQRLFRSLKWIRMVLVYLPAIWGLGYIHIYPRFNSQGNDPCTYPPHRTISMMDFHRTSVLYVTKKLNERPGLLRLLSFSRGFNEGFKRF